MERIPAKPTDTPLTLSTGHRRSGTAYREDVLQMVRLGNDIGYADGWERQRTLHAQRVADEIDDTVLLLEHTSVYTAGRRTETWERPLDGTQVVDVDRGGKITWHGPGQLTGYPIVRLADPVDVVAYVRRLEAALIEVCARLGVETGRVEGRSGVWTPDGRRKVAAIGIRVARGVTMHGFALNCDCGLGPFAAIVPCGYTDAGVTSLSQEAKQEISVADALPHVERELAAVLAGVPSMS